MIDRIYLIDVQDKIYCYAQSLQMHHKIFTLFLLYHTALLLLTFLAIQSKHSSSPLLLNPLVYFTYNLFTNFCNFSISNALIITYLASLILPSHLFNIMHRHFFLFLDKLILHCFVSIDKSV